MSRAAIRCICALAIVPLFSNSYASEAQPADQTELRDLLDLLDKETRIATKTRLNADYVPGIVTVVYGEDLEVRGVRSVAEALETVPGVQVTRDPVGNSQIAIRGVSSSRFSGNVKVLLNDVSVNTSRTGAAHIFGMPIEIVDRIEMVRGPGSAVHGEYAYVGVINIITRTEGQKVFALAAENKTRGGGAVLSWSAPERALRGSLSVSGRRTDGWENDSGLDALYNTGDGLSAYSNAPGPVNDEERAASAIFTLERRGFSLVGQYVEEGLGDHFGVNSILPPDADRIVSRNRTASIEIRQGVVLGAHSNLSFWLNSTDVENQSDSLYLGPPEAFGLGGSADVLLNSDYRERRVSGGVDWLWTPSARHSWLLALAYSETEVLEAAYEWNVAPAGTTGESWFSFPHPIPEGTTRRIASATVQDEIRVTDRFSLTTGLRYDDYSDAGNSLTPRVAGVWRSDEHHILKAQYAEAFRPPTFHASALPTGDTLDPAVIRTWEVGYIHTADRSDSRITLFRSALDDLIVQIMTPEGLRWANAASATTQGIELEHEHRIGSSTRLTASLSYNDTEDEATGAAIAGTSNWLGDVSLLLQPSARLALAVRYRYVGPFNRDIEDPRDKLEAYDTVDLTATFSDLGYKGLLFRVGVKNVLDAPTYEPSPMVSDQYNEPTVSYEADLPVGGRIWWMQLTYNY